MKQDQSSQRVKRNSNTYFYFDFYFTEWNLKVKNNMEKSSYMWENYFSDLYFSQQQFKAEEPTALTVKHHL